MVLVLREHWRWRWFGNRRRRIEVGDDVLAGVLAEVQRSLELLHPVALNLDEPWYKVALMLTVCDIAFGKCALGL